MEKLHALSLDFDQAGLRLDIIGLESHKQLSDHPLASRKRVTVQMRRITVVGPATMEEAIVAMVREQGASGYTAVPCHGGGRHKSSDGHRPLVRFETIVPADASGRILDALREPRFTDDRMTVWIEPVDVLRLEQF